MAPDSKPVFGQRLRDLREARNLTRPMAERLGGLGAGTLKAWELGSRTPRGCALTRLLDALEASNGHRAELIALADPQYARLSLESQPTGPPIELGVILRSFRLRKGWTQADAARAIGVTQGAVAHWESGDRQLEGHALHEALFAFGANAEEVAATLSSPYRSDSSQEEPALVLESLKRVPSVLREPLLLANERALWWQAARDSSWEVHFRRAIIHRAVWYAFMRRFDEIEPLWRRVRQMTPNVSADPDSNVLTLVLSDVRFRSHAPKTALVNRLEEVATSLDDNRVRAWARGTQAVVLATMGERKAVGIARQALKDSARSANLLHESWHRTVDLAEVHLRLGEPEKALETLGDERMEVDYELGRNGYGPAGLPVRARALAALGREPEPELMAALQDHATLDGSPFYENRLERVERDLTAMRRRSARR